MPPECPPITRNLYAWEIQEARRVFANSLNYDALRIHECTPWPNTIDSIGRMFKKQPASNQPNAITLGNNSYFPVRLLEAPVSPDAFDHYKIAWLIHEMTHVWQYQHMGWSYLWKALNAQFQLGAQAYDYGGEAGLMQAFMESRHLTDFNLEQQGDICRSYYTRLCQAQDVTAWMPFITELQAG
jgi:hypothetical protein